MADKKVKLAGLGVQVIGAGVWEARLGGKFVGPLAGARAEFTDGTRPHRVGAAVALAPLTLGGSLLVGLTRKNKASAFVSFTNGSVHERRLDGKSAIAAAQRDAVKFNALAGAQHP